MKKAPGTESTSCTGIMTKMLPSSPIFFPFGLSMPLYFQLAHIARMRGVLFRRRLGELFKTEKKFSLLVNSECYLYQVVSLLSGLVVSDGVAQF